MESSPGSQTEKLEMGDHRRLFNFSPEVKTGSMIVSVTHIRLKDSRGGVKMH